MIHETTSVRTACYPQAERDREPQKSQVHPSLSANLNNQLARTAVVNVLYAGIIAAAKGFLIIGAVMPMVLGMPVFIPVVYIGPTMILKVLACALDAIVIALTLNVSLVFPWRTFPWLLRRKDHGSGCECSKSDCDSKENIS